MHGGSEQVEAAIQVSHLRGSLIYLHLPTLPCSHTLAFRVGQAVARLRRCRIEGVPTPKPGFSSDQCPDFLANEKLPRCPMAFEAENYRHPAV